MGCSQVTGTLADAVAAAYLTSSTSNQATTVSALLAGEPTDLGLVTLAAEVAVAVSAAMDSDGGTTRLVTFDATEPVLALLDAGKLVAAIDQQPFLQGFLPVLFMTTFKTSLMKAENSRLKTGPKLLTTRPAAPSHVHDGDFTLKVVTQGKGGNSFWDVVYLGAVQAAADMGIQLDLTSMCNPNYAGDDPTAMAAYITEALALPASQHPAGIIVSIPNADILGPPIAAAILEDVQVVSLNSGYDSAASLGALLHVGQTDFEAGEMAGWFFANKGGTAGLCLNDEPENPRMVQRCRGFKAALAANRLPTFEDETYGVCSDAAYGVCSVAAQTSKADCIAVDGASWGRGTKAGCEGVGGAWAVDGQTLIGSNSELNLQTITPVLINNPTIDSVLVCGQSKAAQAVEVVRDVAASGHEARTIMVGTFDYGPMVGAMIMADELMFGIHQQPYYQPVLVLAWTLSSIFAGFDASNNCRRLASGKLGASAVSYFPQIMA